jgi:hypothetical protein
MTSTPEPDSVLATLTLDELQDVLRFVEVSESNGHMSPRTADEWRNRVHAWSMFRRNWGLGSAGMPD